MSSQYKPGDTAWAEFVTSRFDTGAATTADSLPTGTLNRNGTDDGAVTVTVTNIDAGRYKATFTIPATYIPTDELNLSVAATVNLVAGKGVVWRARLGVGVVQGGTATAGGASTITLQTALGADHDGEGCLVVLLGGTGSGQAGVITGYVNSTRVATVGRAWVTAPDSTTTYAILAADLPKVDSNHKIAGVVLTDTATTVTNQLTAAQVATGVFQDTTANDSTVAGSIGKSLFTSGNTPGAAGGLFIAGTNAATAVNITGNITGNLVGTVSTLTTYTGNTPQTGDAYAKVSGLTFTVAGQVDANVQYVNDVQVTGTGASGNEWGPA